MCSKNTLEACASPNRLANKALIPYIAPYTITQTEIVANADALAK